MFDTLLIANRGEIACRIISSAKAAGLRTVAVYSSADAGALHVRMADDAVEIGPPPAAQSYLSIEAIIDAAKKSGAGAIHPGYGFLSENAAFARACEEAGIIFVGPPADAIEIMGDKAKAKRAMIAAGVPCVPGYQGDDQRVETLAKEAEKIGFPVMVKAAAGGGGRGMRLVDRADGLKDGFSAARSEAESAFGSGDLILEKAIIEPRHVEIQVFADGHGNIVHLGERDCSVQRRHQKIIEEAPSPALDEKLRHKMGAAAVEAARAVDYRGAGTVEFLLDRDGNFHFLEMNTRLQVEHPVTEMITGRDLVALQLAVAAGKPLGFGQDDVALCGHAIEVRLYAEDPENGFLPSSGPVSMWREPVGAGVRIDAGIHEGDIISPHYDPMVAKIIAWGEDRETARKRLIAALESTVLLGPATNRDFLLDALVRSDFASGEATTAFIENAYGDDGFTTQPTTPTHWAVAAALLYRLKQQQALRAFEGEICDELLGWSSTGSQHSVFSLAHGDDTRQMRVSSTGGGVLAVSMDDHTEKVEVGDFSANTAKIALTSSRMRVYRHHDAATGSLEIDFGSKRAAFRDITHASQSEKVAEGGNVMAPMHGVIAAVSVAPGQRVESGNRLMVLEAMKMQHQITATTDGIVVSVRVTEGQQVSAGDLLVEMDDTN